MKFALKSLVLFALGCGLAFAGAKPGVVYDKAGKFDKSFNQAVYEGGVVKFYKDTGIKVKEIEPRSDAEVLKGLRKLAKKGYTPIVAVGFSMASALSTVAKEYPDTHFTLIDMVVDLPNVQSIIFSEHQGSFLVGALAALKSKSGTIGFVGGMDIPLIHKFGCGYTQGARYVNKDINVISQMTGSTPAAFNDPTKGAELTKNQIEQGADVVFAAAGGTGTGVLQTAKDKGIYSVGVDSNQNYLHPGSVLTSMVKRVGLSAYVSFKAQLNGKWTPGIQVMDLKAGGVDWALDKYNASEVSAEEKQQVEAIKAKIISGEIQVHDYMSNNKCE